MRFLCAFLCLCSLGAPRPGWAGTLAQFRTPVGDLEVELFDESKPVTVQNFLRYVQGGYTNDMIIHRWDDRFVIQGGAYYTANRHTTNAYITGITTYGDITNEFSVGPTLSNSYGTIAMARRGGQTNSASSQWFFNLKDNPVLDQIDGGFTVFGKVVRGTNVLELFNLPSTNSGIYQISLGGALTELPVLAIRPTFEDLVYVDITLLNVQVARTAQGLSEISWQSVSNKVNRVEFTNQFPPVWTELGNTNGTGERLHLVDPEPGTTNRFYRVRVEY